jgi:hypothetical protein
MSPVTVGDRRALRERFEALDRFAEWAADHPTRLAPADAVAAAGRLYELLPVPARRRPVDPGGVMTLHRLLRRVRPSR